MSAKPEVICRLATPADREGVLGISQDNDVYDGMDYLPYMYDYYSKHPKYYNYVLEVDGKIVTYLYFFITDNGTYLIRGGARNHPKHRGKNYLNILKKYSTDHISILFDIPLYRRIQLHVWNDFNKKQFRWNPSIAEKSRLLSVLYFIRKTTTKAALNSLFTNEMFISLCAEHGGIGDIRGLKPAETMQILLNETNKANIFPECSMLVGRHPFNITEENLKYAANTTTIFASVSHDGVCQAVCFVEYMRVQVGSRFDFCYYGASALLPRYVLKSVEYITQYDCTASNVIVVFKVPKYIPIRGMLKVMTQLGWKDKIDSVAEPLGEIAVTMVPLDAQPAKL